MPIHPIANAALADPIDQQAIVVAFLEAVKARTALEAVRTLLALATIRDERDDDAGADTLRMMGAALLPLALGGIAKAPAATPEAIDELRRFVDEKRTLPGQPPAPGSVPASQARFIPRK